jgi:alpha-L-rhamnosidase
VPLLSNADYTWTVSWTRGSNAQHPSPSSVENSSTFSTTLFHDNDWQNAGWLGRVGQRLLRRPLKIPLRRKVVRARAFIAAPGCHALQIDHSGSGYVPVGDQYGICPWTDFGKTVLYQTYDMTSLIKSGNNTLQLFLGNGMWMHPGGLQTGAPAPVVRFLLTVTLDDGTKLEVRSGPDEHWKATRGPYVANDPWSGTTMDCALLSRELPTKEHFVPAAPAVSAPVNATLRSLMMPLSKHVRTLLPVKATLLANTNIRFDFAENFVGVTMLDPVALAAAFRLPNTTTPVSAQHGGGGQGPLANFTAQHCERYHNASSLTPGSVDCLSAGANAKNKNLLSWQTDQYWNVAYTSQKARGLTPRFTWHGYQYVEVSVVGGDATAASVAQLDLSIAVRGIELRTDIEEVGALAFVRRGEDVGGYILNRIQRIVTNSQKANVAAYIPTDCPTREKHGWLGDAVTTAEEAMLNFDMASVYTYYLDTIRDSQRPDGDEPPAVPIKDFPRPNGGDELQRSTTSTRPSSDISWTVAYPLITRWMLKFYNDSRVVKKHYAALKRYTDGLLARAAQSSILPLDFRYGDWCAIEKRAVATNATGPPMAGFNYILAIDAMVDMARVVGNAADAARYIALSASLRKLYWPMFYSKKLRAFGVHELDLQTSTSAPLALGSVIPAASKAEVVASLHADVMTTQRGHLTVGSIGAKHLLPQLSKHGLHDDAMTVATQVGIRLHTMPQPVSD